MTLQITGDCVPSCFCTPYYPLHREPEPGLLNVLFLVSLDIFSAWLGHEAGLCVWSVHRELRDLRSLVLERSLVCWPIKSSKQNR